MAAAKIDVPYRSKNKESIISEEEEEEAKR